MVTILSSCPRNRQQAIQTCLTMKVLFGMALRQTTGFVDNLLRLVGLGRAVPDFSALSRRQKTRAVNIPYPGSKAPLRLPIAAPMPPFRPAGTRSRERPSEPVRSQETKHCAPRNILVGRSGDDGADTIAEVASRPGCIA